MSATAGPHKPKDGWQLRWITQSLHLLLNAPVVFIMILVSSLFLGAVDIQLQSALPGKFSYILQTSLFSAVSIFVVAQVCNVFLTIEDHNPLDTEALLKGAFPVAVGAFIFTSIITSIVMLLHVSKETSGAGSDPFRLPDMSEVEYYMYRGVTFHFMAMQAMIAVNPLWHVTGPTMQTERQHARASMVRMLVAMPLVINILLMSAVMTAVAGMIIGPYAHFFLCVLLMTWHYVAAREIFGGISKNNLKKNEELQLSEA